MDDGDLVPDHKLCGYLCAVLTVAGSAVSGAPCRLFSDSNGFGFESENGVVLSPLDGNAGVSPESLSKGGKRKGKRKMGTVDGSVSVVSQIHALVARKCLKIQARVICVESRDNGEARALVLVDVYLPIELWSGWQFPRSGSLAGAMFRHMSCDWRERRLMLANCGATIDTWKSTQAMWVVSDCHVPGCTLHCNISDHSRKRLFELHEIFKTIPSITNRGTSISSSIKPADPTSASGIWDVADDILIHILTALSPLDLTRVAATCCHLRSLATLVVPCMKLKLFPHQQAAVEWMLKREQKSEVLPHPVYTEFSSEDGFLFYVNNVSGHLITGTGPTVRDFQGGMFCDEPGLGKTITALSLILKTQGTMAEPPAEAQVIWCTPNGSQKCGYYELNDDGFACDSMMLGKRTSQDVSNVLSQMRCTSPKRLRQMDSCEKILEGKHFFPRKGVKSQLIPMSQPATCTVQCTRNLSRIRKNLLYAYDSEYSTPKERKVGGTTVRSRSRCVISEKQAGQSYIMSDTFKESGKHTTGYTMSNDTWVQCDSCRKWRKLPDTEVADIKAAWFCSMNADPAHQRCSDPEEAWDNRQPIRYLPGFCDKQSPGGMEENVSFFIGVLREHYNRINSKTKKALVWLVRLSEDRLSEMETTGLLGPVFGTSLGEVSLQFHRIFQAFGLIKRVQKGITRWYYPQKLENLAFDLPALRIALGKPLEYVRLYLSRATLIVVPSNLVDHWKTQIHKHVRTRLLRLCVWTDNKKPPAHSLAWDYDIVITTFSRLSAEWGPHKRSPLMQVHWLRIILDEGHTLGSSLGLTNKLQMAISLTASNRWILTGTPTPNTPNSQLSHLQPLLKFLHEEPYGQNQKSWENGILRPFEAEMEEGRSRLLQLLHRCMISARKTDVQTIPPCIKTVTFLDFNKEHAKSYNELVVTVRRNILMADWNDPSHVESLLNPRQWKFRSATIRNVRLSCCVAGHIKVMDVAHDIQETMDVLVENGMDPMSEEYAMIKYNLLYGGNCLRCKEWCRLPMITPCRHLLCLNCVALDSEKCTLPGCGNLYEMQTPETLARPENPNPKWPVPKDLIELQPSYKQDDWNPDWQSTSSTKVAYVVEKLNSLRESYIQCHCSSSEREVDKLPSLSQSSLVDATFMNISNVVSNESGRILPDKVLIFSQFLEHMHVIEQQLTIAGIKFAGMYSPMHAAEKMKSLAMFQHDDNCMALLMDGSAALGLDLSFVSYVFLMEPIWDRSMEEQVISRAHRMGATRPIHVETLAMRGTIEEQMLEFLEDSVECRRLLKQTSEKTNNEGTRTCRTLHDFAESNYLVRLSAVQTNSKS